MAQSVAGGVSETALRSVIESMGFAPTKLNKGFLIKVTRDKWTLYVQLVLSDDGTKLGMNANLGEVNVDAVTAVQWRNILVENGDIDPSQFFLNADTKKLYLHRALDNRNMTPQYLASQLDIFMGQVISTEKVWGGITH
ncbi:MAG: hypothetical protein KGM49_10790 [Sphingomonadales bacterium]|nr:hypothetical protein [Sphingomonadales bacterium]